MDLLGDYDSDSESDGGDNLPVTNVPTSTALLTDKKARTSNGSQNKNPSPLLLTAKTKLESTADKKQRVIGKKLLKLSAVLPEHILNQLQMGGGGGMEEDDGESTDDSGNDSSDDGVDFNESSSSRRKAKTSVAAKSSSRDWSKDQGLVGLLNELSKSSASGRQKTSKKILGNDDNDEVSSTKEFNDDSTAIPSSTPSTTSPKSNEVATSEVLGAAFLTTTVQTTKRKRKEPRTIQIIHGNQNEETTSSGVSSYTPVASINSVHTLNELSINNQSSTANAALTSRIKATSSLRLAAPPTRMSATPSSPYTFDTSPIVSSQETNRSYPLIHQTGRNSVGGKGQPKKKKQLSRKRLMEQMLRAGKLDEVQGDQELRGVAHVYNEEGDVGGGYAAMSQMSSSTNRAGVRVVPTGSYDASLGATAMSTDVTSRQKTTNQLNSLLANAASLESHRAQNPQLQFLGAKGKSGSHRATAKRKYGW